MYMAIGRVSSVLVAAASGSFVSATITFPDTGLADVVLSSLMELEYATFAARLVQERRRHTMAHTLYDAEASAALQVEAEASAVLQAERTAAAQAAAAAAGVMNADAVTATRQSSRAGVAGKRALAPRSNNSEFNQASADKCALCPNTRAQCATLNEKRCCKALVCGRCKKEIRRGEREPCCRPSGST